MKIYADRSSKTKHPLYKFVHQDVWIKVRRKSSDATYYIRVRAIRNDTSADHDSMCYNRTNIWPIDDDVYAPARFIHQINVDFWADVNDFEIIEPREIITTNELYEMCGVF